MRLLSVLLVAGAVSAAHAGEVTIPLSLWEGLQTTIEHAGRVRPAPREVLPVDASLTGEFRKGVLHGSLTYSFAVPACDEDLDPPDVPFLDSRSVVARVRLDSKPATVVRRGRMFTVVGVPAGTHLLEASFYWGQGGGRFTRDLKLRLPPASVTHVSIGIPETGVDAKLASGVIVSRTERSGRTDLQGYVAGEYLDLSWKRRLSHEEAAHFEAMYGTFALFSVQSDSIMARQRVDVRVLQGETDRIDLTLPAGVEVLDVTGEAVLQHDQPQGTRSLAIFLRYLVDDEISFVVRFQRPLRNEGATMLSPIWPKGAVSTSGALGIEAPVNLEVRIPQAADCREIPLRKLPTALTDLTPQPLLAGYELTGSAVVLAVEVQPHGSVALTTTVVDAWNSSTVLLEDGTEVTRLHLRIRNNTRQYLQVELPSGATVTHALLDGDVIAPAVVEGGVARPAPAAEGAAPRGEVLKLPLRQSERKDKRYHTVAANETLSHISSFYYSDPGQWARILDANSISYPEEIYEGQQLEIPYLGGAGKEVEESSFVLELAYRRDHPHLSALGRAELFLPRMDADTTEFYWRVYLPQVVEPLAFAGNVHQYSHIRYDVFRRLIHFLQRARFVKTAWAGSYASQRKDLWLSMPYENILEQRKAIYREQQKQKQADVVAAFPLVGVAYRFQKLFLGQDQPRLTVTYVDREWLAPLRLLGFALAVTLTLLVVRGGGPLVPRIGVAAAGGLLLLFLAHYVLGTHRRILWGIDAGLILFCVPHYLPRLGSWFGALWRDPPSLLGLFGWSVLSRLLGVVILLGVVLSYPLLMSSFALIALVVLTLRIKRAAPPAARVTAAVIAALCVAGAPRAIADTNTVTMPLAEYKDLTDQVERIEKESRRQGAFYLSTAAYEGEVAPAGHMQMTLSLDVQLRGRGIWKQVPVIGSEVAVMEARVDGRAIPLARNGRYHYWYTDREGSLRLSVRFLVDAYGPRGSREYRFAHPSAAVTAFACQFPVEGLKPRVDRASNEEITAVRGGTLYRASIAPTEDIRVVGMRDIRTDVRQAKLYSQSQHLLSLEEETMELFSVFNYTILYGGQREFRLELPAGWTLISAVGQGAPQFTLEEGPDGTGLLRGETAFPIDQRYEISLRLRRTQPKGELEFQAPLPRSLGVEREQGYLAVEVPGKLEVGEVTRKDVDQVDIRQLPPQMLESAVSPILLAYRYHTGEARLRLRAERLPERAPDSMAVDRVRAFTKLTPDGVVSHEVRYTLRNQLRRSLAVTLPVGFDLESCELDGRPIQPSRTRERNLLLPLRRSLGGDGRAGRSFNLQMVVSGTVESLGSVGRRHLALPVVDLPVSSLAWTVFVPGNNVYTRLESDVEPQRYLRSASWHGVETPTASSRTRRARDDTGMANQALEFEGRVQQADAVDETHGPAAGAARPAPFGGEFAGAMPIRLQVPKTGIRLEYQRYWLPAGAPVDGSFWFLRSWLRYPLASLSLLALLGVVWVARYTQVMRTPRAVSAGVIAAVGLGLSAVAMGGRVALTLVLMGAAVVALWSWIIDFSAARLAPVSAFGQRALGRLKDDLPEHGIGFWLVRVFFLGALAVLGVVLLVQLLFLLDLLGRPL